MHVISLNPKQRSRSLCVPHQFDIVVYERAYAVPVAGIPCSALPEGTGEVIKGNRQRWPPVRSTRAARTDLGTAVWYNRSFHVWRSSAALSASIKVSRSLCSFVFLIFRKSLRIFLGLRVHHTRRGACALDTLFPFSYFRGSFRALPLF